MKLTIVKNVLMLLGLIALLPGSGMGISHASTERESIMFMDGPLAHAMDHQETSGDTQSCPGKDGGKSCDDCYKANCSTSGCSASLLHETQNFDVFRVSQAKTPSEAPALIGLERQYLPLPPP